MASTHARWYSDLTDILRRLGKVPTLPHELAEWVHTKALGTEERAHMLALHACNLKWFSFVGNTSISLLAERALRVALPEPLYLPSGTTLTLVPGENLELDAFVHLHRQQADDIQLIRSLLTDSEAKGVAPARLVKALPPLGRFLPGRRPPHASKRWNGAAPTIDPITHIPAVTRLYLRWLQENPNAPR